MEDDLDFEASLLTFGGQEEVPKLQQLTPSGQIASALTQNTNASFIVRLPVDDPKSMQRTTAMEMDFFRENRAPLGHTAAELSRDKDERFIVQLPINNWKPSTSENTQMNGVAARDEITLTEKQSYVDRYRWTRWIWTTVPSGFRKLNNKQRR